MLNKWVLGALLSLATAGVFAQSAYPSKPLHIIVPFTAGSGTDVIARAIGDALSKSTGQPVIIENKPGAGGTLGAAQVARAEPDGYTLLVHSAGHAVNQTIYPNLPYDTLRDFIGITPLANLPNVLVVPPARGWKTTQDLVAAAKSKPGQLNFGSAGVGSATHINAEKFRLQAGIDIVHVPFRGTPEALSEVIAGRIDLFFAPLVSALPLIRDGKVQALAVSTPARSTVLPGVPTTVEAGTAGSDYVFWVGMLVPSKTPREIVRRLHEETIKALSSPEVTTRLASLGAEPMPMAPEAFDTFIRAEVEQSGRIARAASLKPQ
jgi:tripartite-type tricarboxylate transporter receptor subunit TctC